MKKFLYNLGIFTTVGLIPFLILLVGYWYFDPFKVLRKYSNFSHQYIMPNRDYISTETFLANRRRYPYNSFIFGSSRTMAFRPQSWKKHLRKEDIPFVFDASEESVYGIYTKLRFLDSLHSNIDNVLILLCRDVSFDNYINKIGCMFLKDPHTSGGNFIGFQAEFLKAYFNPSFLFCFYNYTFTHRFKRYMGSVIETRDITYDTITNALTIVDQEKEIVNTPDEYYKRRKSIFYPRDKESVNALQQIRPPHLQLLRGIKEILERHHTDYKIILSPLYEQVKYAPADQAILKGLFGNRLYDFTGKNFFTDSITHYYETGHFRPAIGDSIMSIIYEKDR